jgi:hypothetical protein
VCTNGLTSLSPFAITSLSPTAAKVSVSGRVLTSTGAGLKGATVMMTDASGRTRSALTNAFGHYSFDGVMSGETFTFVVSSRRYVFSPKVVNINDQLSDLDFSALY